MPYRAYHLVLGIAGLLAVVLLVILRANVDRQARTGPRWKQRLVAAGLMVLAAFGLGPACKGGGTPTPAATSNSGGLAADPGDAMRPANPRTPPSRTPPRPTGYLATPEWKQIQNTLKEAEAIATGKRGSHPFDRAGKKRFLAAMQKAQTHADTLATRGLLALAEVGLLKVDLAQLRAKVSTFRPTEMRMTTCYEKIARPLAAEVSMGRLRTRLPLLKKLALAKKLHPAVVSRVLIRIQKNLRILEAPTEVARLHTKRQVEAKNLAGEVRTELTKVLKRIGQPPVPGTGLATNKAWQQVVAAWKYITPLAANSSASTTTQRKQADGKMKAALAAVDGLAKAGKITAAEAQLLKDVAARLRTDMHKSRPSDLSVKCYKTKYIDPARASLGRLSTRLPLLQKMVASGRVKPPVLARVLPSVRRDLTRLTDARRLKRLRPDEKKMAAALATKIQTVLRKIEALTKGK
jgi:hypothetical protein